MSMFRFGSDSFVWLIWIEVVVAALLLVLLLATLASRHLVLSQRWYLGCALVAFLVWLEYLGASGQVFRYSTGGTSFIFLFLFVPLLPYILLAEVAVLYWLGAQSPWREVLVIVTILAGSAMIFPRAIGNFFRP